MSSKVFSGSKLHFEATVEAKIRTSFRIDDIVVADGPWMFPETKDICPQIWKLKGYLANGVVLAGNCQGREGSTAQLRCDKMRGYKFKKTNSGSMATNCVRRQSGRTGKWVPNNGVCVLAKCGSPPKIPNATVANIMPDPNISGNTDPSIYNAYTTVEYKCTENTTYISGPKQKRCGLDDTWSLGAIQCMRTKIIAYSLHKPSFLYSFKGTTWAWDSPDQEDTLACHQASPLLQADVYDFRDCCEAIMDRPLVSLHTLVQCIVCCSSMSL
ncbi:uncharacterized protein LOC135493005 [Lineus longissimus]|uniref:uncharacterized protein LOC135493005 n=1 Tax=Lineus longissimus TaxID=88925 RepID=UPI00315D7C09